MSCLQNTCEIVDGMKLYSTIVRIEHHWVMGYLRLILNIYKKEKWLQNITLWDNVQYNCRILFILRFRLCCNAFVVNFGAMNMVISLYVCYSLHHMNKVSQLKCHGLLSQRFLSYLYTQHLPVIFLESECYVNNLTDFYRTFYRS